MDVTVTLNSSAVNPWHRLGLKRNPFPQVPKAEAASMNAILASLDADPITDVDDLRCRLVGCAPEFVSGCIARLVPGERTKFTISFPDPWPA